MMEKAVPITVHHVKPVKVATDYSEQTCTSMLILATIIWKTCNLPAATLDKSRDAPLKVSM